MKIRLTLRRDPAEAKDLAVTVDGLATVADIATQLWAADPERRGTRPPENLSLCIDEAFVAGGMRGNILNRADNLLESGLRPGSIVSLKQVSEQFAAPGANRGPAAATLRVLSGPDVGREFSLPSGTSYIGRDRDVDIRLADPMTSKRHARITVGETVEIVDTNSANGLIMDGLPVTRATLNSSDTVTLGDTTVSVVGLGHHGGAPTSPMVDFNRSPRVVPRFAPPKRVLPAGPKRVENHPFPYIMLIAPLMMGAILFCGHRQRAVDHVHADDAAVHRRPLRGPKTAKQAATQGTAQAVPRSDGGVPQGHHRAAAHRALRAPPGGPVRQRHRRFHLQARTVALDAPSGAQGIPGPAFRAGYGAVADRLRGTGQQRNRSRIHAGNPGLPQAVPGH